MCLKLATTVSYLGRFESFFFNKYLSGRHVGLTSVMPLVESPGLADGQVLLVDLLQHLLQRGLGAGQQRGVGQVEAVARVLERLPTALGLRHAGLRQVGVKPERIKCKTLNDHFSGKLRWLEKKTEMPDSHHSEVKYFKTINNPRIRVLRIYHVGRP